MEKLRMKMIFFIGIMLLSIPSYALIIVSDLDDTIKITNTRDTSERNYNGLFNLDAFAGMSHLMDEMGTYTRDLYYVSASPKIINSRIEKFFKHNDLSVTDLFTRGFRDLGDKENFKLRSIIKILKQSNDKIILIGDDSESDELIYKKINKMFPARVAATYIHNVYNQAPTSKAIRFFTAYDIAVSEYLAQRMSLKTVLEIGFDLVKSKKMDLYFPDFAFCPSKKSDFSASGVRALAALDKAVSLKILAFCSL